MRRLPLAATLVMGVASACGGGTPAKPPATTTDDGRAALAKKTAANAMAVKGYIIASVGEHTVGPFFARRPDGAAALAVWVTAAEGSGRRVVAVPISGAGEPRGPEKTIANVGVDTLSLVVKPLRNGFAVAWTSLTDNGQALWATVAGDDGSARNKPVELAHTTDAVAWVDLFATDSGAACVWAEDQGGGTTVANILSAGLDTDGKVRGVPSRVATGVRAWHALEIPGGVGVTTFAGEKTDTKLDLQRLDVEGRVNGTPVTIAKGRRVNGDVEVVRQGKQLVFAWTDRSATEPTVAAAALDDGGTVVAPRVVVSAPATLLGLASGPNGAGILWEGGPFRGSEAKRVYIARIGDGLSLAPPAASFDAVGRGAPEIAPTASGFAVLANAKDCDDGTPACATAAAVPSLLRVDGTGAIVQREPLGFGGDTASMAWNLTCTRDDSCFALAASGAGPARVRTTAISPRVNVVKAAAPAEATAAAPAPPKDGPHIVDVAAIASGESVVDIAAAQVQGATMLAMLTAKADQPQKAAKGEEPKAATLVLTTRIVNEDGTTTTPNVITSRALAVGGVAIAPAEKPEEGAAIAWVARENGDPEVHVTRLDKKGKRANDVQLTTTKGDASDVAIAWAKDGWIVAWVDGRDGNGEVYATRIGMDLNRVAREERITNAPGDASDLVALAKDDKVWLAWADPRESPKDGMADVYATAVKMRDAKRAVDETRLLATAPHSRTPQLATTESGVAVAWVEEAPMGSEAPSQSGYGAMWATLDAKGKLEKAPARIPAGGEGAVSAIAIEPSPGGIRTVVARGGDAIVLDALLLGQSAASPLVTLDGPPSLDVALVIHRGVLFFNDDGPNKEDKRARRARIDWTPAK